MFSPRDMPSPSSIFSAYASMTASIMLLRSMANELIPHPIRGYLFNTFRYLIRPRSPTLTLIIEESTGIARNQVYDAAEAYLSTRVSPENERLKISKSPKEKKLTIRLEKGEKVVDCFNGACFKWRFICAESEKNNPNDHSNTNISVRSEKRSFELSFPKKLKEMVLDCYLPFILEKAKEMKDEERVLKMHTLNTSYCFSGVKWDSINLEHPSTFETLAMEPELKNAVIEDLDRFVKRREFYKRVGRAWKRGYLLYGPPGTGKSSLIAAMANYLKFDIFDLQLGNIVRDSDLRKLLLATANRSILVIEDIDCSVDLPERRHGDGRKQTDVQAHRASDGWMQLTLSGLLNFIDGLWSSCGDERIIIFTTNHKERLDPALLRPGRMDMHIHMSYCSYQGFKLLASNYLETSSEHPLFGEIEGLIEDIQITPAQVAEELMKNEDAEATLEAFVKLLKRKKMEGDVCENYGPQKAEPSKRRKVGCKQKRGVGISKSNIGVTQRRTRRMRRECSF
ncbi:AAA-ATPase At5g17760-like isoform X1 [Vigna unguiculata]|uniref:Mitochondrial chaperone BCS1 n=1 Tax=Vigna unguiculata TaxID=3917 RepID=A0A4D6LQ86_VIGUN|nr:AAA-ATPase At5g17760-like isoform X1 [Vigna unguiculata]QCD91062.1 mitochondrial chaperone BCS1 [Vigna unguiculata]